MTERLALGEREHLDRGNREDQRSAAPLLAISAPNGAAYAEPAATV